MDSFLNLPNIRYVRIYHLEEVVGLYQLQGSDEDIAQQAKDMQDQYQFVDPHITVELLSKEEGKVVNWKIIMNGCVPWEQAKTRIHSSFEYSFNWN